jgi:hypothetical protein
MGEDCTSYCEVCADVCIPDNGAFLGVGYRYTKSGKGKRENEVNWTLSEAAA